ncbi:hypothetical protein [Pelotomaculum propionicicum]|uniref:EamA domain-containing protein n=1 Tax=Pelotomaculum propionicicum TaxID=258475 RepID=A0A4Y7RVN6_9FIRM|nr:hypothetical protein [Pelotomaculum propionicicum]NLI12619.1 hypothetical protein [Peptococcaceae bacterium]TEB12799.1 hypothetical protein Pmgp_00775 [Pelotomaculum propionicicum]
MAFILVLLVFGSAVLAFMIAWQVRYVQPEFLSVTRFNLYMLPLILAANIALATAFIRANSLLKNLPLLAAAQSFFYYMFVVGFSILIVGEKISLGRAALGFGMMAAGVWVLKK